MALAFWIIIGAAVVWLITSGFIYAGVYILKFMTVFPDEKVFTFGDALNYGELIAMAFIAAGIIAGILNALNIIDLRALTKKG